MKPTIYSLIFVLALGIGADALGRHIIKSNTDEASVVSTVAEEI